MNTGRRLLTCAAAGAVAALCLPGAARAQRAGDAVVRSVGVPASLLLRASRVIE